jgi:RNA polymerase sigma-70 factor (ECF subfamily)
MTIAYRKTNDREVSKEIVQNVFIALHNNKASAHQINSLRAYLYTILKNRILDHFRRELAENKFHDQCRKMYVSASESDAYDHMHTKELESLLSEEISRLPPQCQIVFRMRRDHDLSNKEIASLLNISVNTVEQHMRKAIRILRIAFNIGKKAMLLFFLIQL